MLPIFLSNTLYSQNYNLSIMEKDVLGVIKAFNKAFAANDVERYFSFIHEEITLFIPSSPYRIEGKVDDKEEFVWSLERERTKVGFFQELQPKIQVLNESTALVTYHNRGAYGAEENESILYLKESNLLIKENNKWKIIHIHVSK